MHCIAVEHLIVCLLPRATPTGVKYILAPFLHGLGAVSYIWQSFAFIKIQSPAACPTVSNHSLMLIKFKKLSELRVRARPDAALRLYLM